MSFNTSCVSAVTHLNTGSGCGLYEVEGSDRTLQGRFHLAATVRCAPIPSFAFDNSLLDSRRFFAARTVVPNCSTGHYQGALLRVQGTLAFFQSLDLWRLQENIHDVLCCHPGNYEFKTV